jgi:WD40 repeat protein
MCSNVVISAATGVARTLPGPASYADPWPWRDLPGVASPDGTWAAVVVTNNPGTKAWLDLVSLSSGAVLRVPVPVARDSSSRSLAWSPDSRWLFVVTADGGLAIVNARTGQPGILSLGLSGLRQIVIRPAAG